MDLYKIALEYERGLFSKPSPATALTIAHRASEFLSHPENLNPDGSTKVFHKEATDHLIEFNSRPTPSIRELALNFLRAEEICDRISEEQEVLAIPCSKNGVGIPARNSEPYVTSRLTGYEIIFGPKMVDQLLTTAGIHYHIDRSKNRRVDQFNALTALRPALALTSTSPLSDKGENSLNCHRYNTIADPEEGMFRGIPEEVRYINSEEDLQERDLRRHDKWKKRFQTNRKLLTESFQGYGLEQFLKAFPVEKTGYPDIRNRPQMGSGTFEGRTNDTAPVHLVLAHAALVLGYNNQILRGDIPISIARKFDRYQFERKQIILPSRETLNQYTSLAIKHGLENKKVQQYLSVVLEFAYQGLPNQEQHFLDPYFEMLESGKNLASQLIDYIGPKDHYLPADSAFVNHLIWDRHREGIYTLKQKMRM